MFWAVAVAIVVIAAAWLIRINTAMQSVPDEARKVSPRRWTREQLRDAYEGGSGEPLCPVN
jgi:hypothetical protein